ncbi:MAG: alpha/beta hydrolase [Ferruginibacter sp.]|nr:alpha/beta hydrolase [Ferruginibacter sp.]
MKLNSLRNAFISVIFLLTIYSCQKEITATPNNPNVAQTILNVSYGTDPQQQMDIYLPASRSLSTTKVLVLIHGGSWTAGDKSDFTPFLDTMKRRLPDYAIFNINYRLSAAPNNLFPTQEMDVKAAVSFISGKSIEYQLSDKYVLLGASAGGHLAMLQGYKYNAPIKPKAIVSFFGPSDLTDMYNNPVGGNPLISFFMAQAIGSTPSQDLQLYVNSSPLNFISSTSAPTILLHGGLDDLVSPSQSTKVRDKLQAAGVINQYVFYPTGDHGVWSDPLMFDAFNKIELFLTTNVL